MRSSRFPRKRTTGTEPKSFRLPPDQVPPLRAGRPAPPSQAAERASARHTSGDVVLRHRRALTWGVAGRHRAEDLVTLAVVVLRIEEDDHERLLGLGVVKHDELAGRESLRRLPFLHLAGHLVHPVLADPVEGHNACECHSGLLIDCGNPTPSARAPTSLCPVRPLAGVCSPRRGLSLKNVTPSATG